jgi:hypothetical protein
MEKFDNMKNIEEECEKKRYKEPQLKEIGSILKETQTNAQGSNPDNPSQGSVRLS